MKLWRFEPVDSLFFRDSTPFNTSGSNLLFSQPVPTAQTMQGIIRTTIGEMAGADWKYYKGKGKCKRTDIDLQDIDLDEQIGDASRLGRLKLSGPYLLRGNERLYPVPLHVLRGRNTSGCQCLTRLVPGEESINCDLGKRRRLPVLLDALEGAKTLEGYRLTPDGMRAVLN